MPRNEDGVWAPLYDFNLGPINGRFRKELFAETLEDFAGGLNDLPLAAVVPTVVPWGTDAASVNPGSLMDDPASGITYYRPSYAAIWVDISTPGLTDRATVHYGETVPPAGYDWWYKRSRQTLYVRVDDAVWQQIG